VISCRDRCDDIAPQWEMRLSSRACNVGCESDVFWGVGNLRLKISSSSIVQEERRREGKRRKGEEGDGWI
jgi:hypothetical protein